MHGATMDQSMPSKPQIKRGHAKPHGEIKNDQNSGQNLNKETKKEAEGITNLAEKLVCQRAGILLWRAHSGKVITRSRKRGRTQ